MMILKIKIIQQMMILYLKHKYNQYKVDEIDTVNISKYY